MLGPFMAELELGKKGFYEYVGIFSRLNQPGNSTPKKLKAVVPQHQDSKPKIERRLWGKTWGGIFCLMK